MAGFTVVVLFFKLRYKIIIYISKTKKIRGGVWYMDQCTQLPEQREQDLRHLLRQLGHHFQI